MHSEVAYVERAIAVSVAPYCATIGPYMPLCIYEAVDVNLHDQLKDRLSNAAKYISLIVLRNARKLVMP